MAKAARTGISVGLNHGFVTTRLTQKQIRPRPALRAGKLGKRVELVRKTVREVCGFAPYEKRALELLKTGLAKDIKRCGKLCRRKLGSHRRGKNKKSELEQVLRDMRRK